MHILHCCVLMSCMSVWVNLEMFGRYDSLYIMFILLIYPSVGVDIAGYFGDEGG